jgi:hypothetical protein
MRRISTVAAVLLCLAGAAGAQGWAIKFAQGPDPATARWSSWPHPTACNGVSFDPVSVFRGPTEAELGTGGAELALRRYLDEGVYSHLPTRFWRLVAATETSAHFASGRLEQGLFWLGFQLVDGQWRPTGELEECRAQTERGGRAATPWTLADGDAMTKRSRRIRVHILDKRCQGFRDPRTRAEAPEIDRFGKRLVVTIWLEPLPPGKYKCPKPKTVPLVVRLPGALGERQLWDGSVYPPRRER